MPDDPLLFRRGLLPFATGGIRYVDGDREYPGLDARIVIPVSIGSISKPVLAVVDTAASWCIFEREVGARIAQGLTRLPSRVILSTRLGIFQGFLYRGQITLSADEGESLDVDSTMFVCPDWPGPNFLGYQGLLQRIRFAVDPESNLFYFGPI
ncbi:MAG: hypothetical protein WAM82_08375 [Thermoanaerobaculia bacterium]